MKPSGTIARWEGVACLAGYALAGGMASARAVPVAITYYDSDGEGFNSNAVYTTAPYSAEHPTTLGAARRHAFEDCARSWGQRLAGDAPLTIAASFASLGGSGSYVIVGSAGPVILWTLTADGACKDTWYVGALAANFRGFDPQPDVPMIQARFNGDLDAGLFGNMRYYYGTDGKPPTGTGYRFTDFCNVCLHEIAHGLGFCSLLDAPAGVPSGEFTDLGGFRYPSVFDRLLVDGVAENAAHVIDMTVAQRKAIQTSGALYLGGTDIRALNGGDNARLYAPSLFQWGSSIAHLNESTYWGTSASSHRNELMTPVVGPGISHAPGPIVTGLFQDMGYRMREYTMADAASALKIAAGVEEGDDDRQALLNVEAYTTFPPTVDLLDALTIARKAASAAPNP